MNKNYQIADLASKCISEINELQEKLKQETNEDIVLVAYQPSQGEH